VAVAIGVEAGDADGDADGSTGVGEGAAAEVVAGDAVGPVVLVDIGLGAGGDDPAGAGVAGAPAHAARITPRRRDATRRFEFICRRRCCGLGRR
jgi:hypothetical protein